MKDSKVCPRCGEEKTLTEFTKDRSRLDGLEVYCRECKRIYQIYHSEKYREKITAHSREYNQRPEVKQRKKEYERRSEVRKRRREQDKNPARRQRKNELRRTPEAKQKQKEYDHRRSQFPIVKDKHRIQVTRYAKEHPEWKMVQREKQRAKKKGVPFDLSSKDIIIPEVCPILGIRLRANTGEKTEYSPSIDEIIPGVGYVLGNVAVISDRADTIKNDGTADEHEKIANWMNQIALQQNAKNA
jgi:hypothetical protein